MITPRILLYAFSIFSYAVWWLLSTCVTHSIKYNFKHIFNTMFVLLRKTNNNNIVFIKIIIKKAVWWSQFYTFFSLAFENVYKKKRNKKTQTILWLTLTIFLFLFCFFAFSYLCLEVLTYIFFILLPNNWAAIVLYSAKFHKESMTI